MSEQPVENGSSTASAETALTTTTGSTTTTILPTSNTIIITKSIKLNESVSPAKTVDQENLNESANKDKVDLKALTPEQKLEMRMKKFGVQSENSKLSNRAQRFGLSAAGGAVDESKLNKRAERFGIAANGTAPSTPTASADLLEKRSKRFGSATESANSTSSPASESSDALLKRKERFGMVNEEDKKKLRSARFETKA